jgi:uncharacterized protein (TIGR02300 family)
MDLSPGTVIVPFNGLLALLVKGWGAEWGWLIKILLTEALTHGKPTPFQRAFPPIRIFGAYTVVNPEWGIKRTCHSCGAKYYDFKKKTPTCPSCGTPFDPEALLKSRRRVIPEEKVKVPEKVEDVEVDTDEDDKDKPEGDDVLEDTADLGGDDVEVVEAEEEEES